MSFDLDQRTGWPAELRVLLECYPRASWGSHGSGMARFWLEIHEGFRRQATELQAAAAAYREGRTSPDRFGTWVAPRLEPFIAHLHGHHQIEDYHYFPSFRAAEQRLAAGFDALAKDHELIHESLVAIIGAANEFLTAIRESAGKDTLQRAGDLYADAEERLCRRVLRHLEDEEDLVIPVMIERERPDRG